MEIAVRVLLFVLSILFIVKGGDFFVDSASDFAKRLHIPQLVVGATIVSIATTLPELLIAIFSSLDGTTELAVGNAVGSALCNIGLVCGISFVAMPSNLEGSGNLKFYLAIIVSAFLLVLGFFFELFVWQAFVLLGFAILFFVANLIDAKSSPYKNQKPKEDEKRSILLSLIYFVVGAAGVGGGAWLLTEEATFLANAIGVSEKFVGLTVVAIGTSLPELTTTLASMKKGKPYLGIGNIIGSNILNLTLILGVARLVAWNHVMEIEKQTAFVTLPFLFLLTVLLTVPLLVKSKTYRFQGIVFLSLYVLYVAFLVLSAFVPLF